VKTELDSLATALYVKTDDLLKDSPHLAPWRPAVGIAPKLTDAELVTLAMMQAMLGFTSEARWLRHARSHLRNLFPYLPQQPGYNKRLRKAADLLRRVTRLLATDTSVWSDDVWIVDSTPVECGRSRETVKRSDLAGWAEYGYCASHSRFFWGLRLHLVCTLQEPARRLRPDRGQGRRTRDPAGPPLRRTRPRRRTSCPDADRRRRSPPLTRHSRAMGLWQSNLHYRTQDLLLLGDVALGRRVGGSSGSRWREWKPAAVTMTARRAGGIPVRL
jgi:hypothetical protein